ncbi:MAG: chemotaxis response regulator protein-glutamate methylesterase [Phycisphaerae bacterium]|nr:chemotaxis response regulator protein-glutamate methylesterase [Phycisphaerae bacterium]
MIDKKVKILVVDDTVTYRKIISDILNKVDGFEVVGTAANGKIALDKLDHLRPDVITLDLEMPVMDGLEVLQELKKRKSSIGAIMLSAFTTKGADTTVKALDLGAFDFVVKPSAGNIEENEKLLLNQLCPKIDAFIRTNSVKCILAGKNRQEVDQKTKITAEPVIPKQKILRADPGVTREVVVLGISTGGPQSLSKMLPELSGDFPVPILIVQHMPPMFTKSLANDLNKKCQLNVCEASHGQRILPGNIYIAPGGKQMKVIKKLDGKVIEINNDPPENSCKPAVDYLFRSVAHVYGQHALGVIMTGMGNDGTMGCRLLKRQGAMIIVQDQASCVVYGMPKLPTEEGLADTISSLDHMSMEITNSIKRGMALCR